MRNLKLIRNLILMSMLSLSMASFANAESVANQMQDLGLALRTQNHTGIVNALKALAQNSAVCSPEGLACISQGSGVQNLLVADNDEEVITEAINVLFKIRSDENRDRGVRSAADRALLDVALYHSHDRPEFHTNIRGPILARYNQIIETEVLYGTDPNRLPNLLIGTDVLRDYMSGLAAVNEPGNVNNPLVRMSLVNFIGNQQVSRLNANHRRDVEEVAVELIDVIADSSLQQDYRGDALLTFMSLVTDPSPAHRLQISSMKYIDLLDYMYGEVDDHENTGSVITKKRGRLLAYGYTGYYQHPAPAQGGRPAKSVSKIHDLMKNPTPANIEAVKDILAADKAHTLATMLASRKDGAKEYVLADVALDDEGHLGSADFMERASTDELLTEDSLGRTVRVPSSAEKLLEEMNLTFQISPAQAFSPTSTDAEVRTAAPKIATAEMVADYLYNINDQVDATGVASVEEVKKAIKEVADNLSRVRIRRWSILANSIAAVEGVLDEMSTLSPDTVADIRARLISTNQTARTHAANFAMYRSPAAGIGETDQPDYAARIAELNEIAVEKLEGPIAMVANEAALLGNSAALDRRAQDLAKNTEALNQRNATIREAAAAVVQSISGLTTTLSEKYDLIESRVALIETALRGGEGSEGLLAKVDALVDDIGSYERAVTAAQEANDQVIAQLNESTSDNADQIAELQEANEELAEMKSSLSALQESYTTLAGRAKTDEELRAMLSSAIATDLSASLPEHIQAILADPETKAALAEAVYQRLLEGPETQIIREDDQSDESVEDIEEVESDEPADLEDIEGKDA